MLLRILSRSPFILIFISFKGGRHAPPSVVCHVPLPSRFEKINSTYAIEGDTLFINTKEEGGVETLELHRIGDATAVVQTTWGDLKAARRP